MQVGGQVPGNHYLVLFSAAMLIPLTMAPGHGQMDCLVTPLLDQSALPADPAPRA
eukprot:COSAG03_NODE_16892_length_389_cov_1.034483_1_plen_54_part_01